MPDRPEVTQATDLPLLSVVILNYRTPALVLDLLETLRPEIDPLRHRVVVVDNASGDDSVEVLQRALAARPEPWLRLLVAPVNGGFAAGNNLGIRAQPARHYLLINSDTLVRPGALTGLLDAAQRHPDVGLVGPRLEWPDGTPQISAFTAHSPASELIQAAGIGLVTRLLRRHEVPRPLQSQAERVDWVSFACVLIKDEVIQSVGGLDEGYFMYYEDTDYCLSARRVGWGTLIEPGAHVVHLRGGSGNVKADLARRRRPARYLYASRTRYFRRHHGPLGPLRANLAWMAGHALACLRFLIDRRMPPACKAQWRDNWIHFTHPSRPYRAASS